MTEPLEVNTESEQPIQTFEEACAAYWRGEWRAMPRLMKIGVVAGILIYAGLLAYDFYAGTHQAGSTIKSV